MKNKLSQKVINKIVATYEFAPDLHQLARELEMRSARELMYHVNVLRLEGIAVPKRTNEVIKITEQWKADHDQQ